MPYSAHLADHFSTFFDPSLREREEHHARHDDGHPGANPLRGVTEKSPAAGVKLVTTEEPRRAGGATTTVDLRAMEVCLAAVTPARAGTVKPATAAMALRMRFGIWATEISPTDEISILSAPRGEDTE